jgi:hypothetical protein
VTALTYSLDTSALIDGIERFYPRRHFPKLWDHVDALISHGRLLISEEAWTEAISTDAPVKEWCEETGMGRASSMYATTSEVASVAGDIVSQFPQWSEQGGKNGADPFVIAVAEVKSGMVISGETNGGPAKPKIPYVCAQRQIDHGKLIDLIRKEDWVVG